MRKPWASFCISTYKRPEFIRNQVALLLQQTFSDFEIVVSDNDPERSASASAYSLKDERVKYFNNGANLGMIASFNKSIERANGDFIVMVTDDDPVDPGLLEAMHNLYMRYPDFSLYGGFRRHNRAPGNVELIAPKDFLSELLDPAKTPWFLWSSCVVDRQTALEVNMIPDYGSPHLADHAFLTLAGSAAGAVIINTPFSTLNIHDSNFSKFNFQYYINGCRGFHDILTKNSSLRKRDKFAISKHLRIWFITSIFNLKRYYTVTKPNEEYLAEIDKCARQILQMPYMRHSMLHFSAKSMIFRIKRRLGLL